MNRKIARGVPQRRRQFLAGRRGKLLEPIHVVGREFPRHRHGVDQQQFPRPRFRGSRRLFEAFWTSNEVNLWPATDTTPDLMRPPRLFSKATISRGEELGPASRMEKSL